MQRAVRRARGGPRRRGRRRGGCKEEGILLEVEGARPQHALLRLLCPPRAAQLRAAWGTSLAAARRGRQQAAATAATAAAAAAASAAAAARLVLHRPGATPRNGLAPLAAPSGGGDGTLVLELYVCPLS